MVVVMPVNLCATLLFQRALNITAANVVPSTVRPDGTIAVQAVLQYALFAAGSLEVRSQPDGLSCTPATIPPGATNATTNCTVDSGTNPGSYMLIVTVTSMGESTDGTGSVVVLQVRRLEMAHTRGADLSECPAHIPCY